MKRRLPAVGVAVIALALAATPAMAATTVASWQMNTTSGPMVDATGAHPGNVGTNVGRSGSFFTFKWINPSHGIYDPQHIVTVPNSTDLNPGTGTWTISARFRTTHDFGNMMQKGQGGGQYFKMETASTGRIKCLFRGAAGSKSVHSGYGSGYDDGQWHTATCRRQGNTVTLTVDGNTKQGTGPTGQISNKIPFSIGGKSQCDAVNVTCDYWVGDLDWVRIDVG